MLYYKQQTIDMNPQDPALHNNQPEVSFKKGPQVYPSFPVAKDMDQEQLTPEQYKTPATQIQEHFVELLKDIKSIAPEYNSATYQFTEKELSTLSKAFLQDHSVSFACLYAGITRRYYRAVIQVNPDMQEFFEDLQKIPEAMAQETVVANLSSAKLATWYLERRASNKYNTKTVVEAQGGLADALDRLEQQNNSPHVVAEQ